MSDEADRRRAYAELAGRGQPVPGKNFGVIKKGIKIKDDPPVKTIDMTKAKQLKLFRLGGLSSADPIGDKRRKEDAAALRKLKKTGKARKIRTKPVKLTIQSASITKPAGMNIQKNMIMPKMAKEGGLMTKGNLRDAIEKVKAKEMKVGGEAVPPKFKGFSKLPEPVQQKMNPDLAEKFGMGGDVKGKKGKNICRGRGIARPGTGFTVR